MRPDKKEKFGWCLYDWANSAFAATILAAILPVYFAESIVPANGAKLAFFGWKGSVSATSLWGYASGLTSLLILLSAPVLGAIADKSQRKKAFLVTFCFLGSFLTSLLFFSSPSDIFYVLLIFCLAQYCFVGGNVFYDAFLPFLAKGTEMDRLSGNGYALGYLGGGLLLALNVLFIQCAPIIGVQKEMAVRLSFVSAGIWWAFFGAISFRLFHESAGPHEKRSTLFQSAVEGLQNVRETIRVVRQSRNVLLFLVAYMIYNEGVQTVIRMASIYGKEELGLSTGTLLGTLLMVQFVGIGGAILMSWIAARFGIKQTIMAILASWFALTIFAYGMTEAWEFWFLGGGVGLILGGTQALSRSFYGRMIPREQSAQFFGYFSVFAKMSAIWGPILFAFIRQMTGTSRLSVLSLSVFFLVGCGMLFFVKEEGQKTAHGARRRV